MYKNDDIFQAKVNCVLKTIAGRLSVACTLVFKQKLENCWTNRPWKFDIWEFCINLLINFLLLFYMKICLRNFACNLSAISEFL